MKTRSQNLREDSEAYPTYKHSCKTQRFKVKLEKGKVDHHDSVIEKINESCITVIKMEEINTKVDFRDENTPETGSTIHNLEARQNRCSPSLVKFKFCNEPNFICRWCPKSFKSKHNTKKHEKTHIPSAQRAKFKCTFCNKHYICKRDLRRHAEIHLLTETERNKYECLFCRKSFGRKSGLKDHEKTHLPDSERVKYTCSTCNKSFKWKKHLYRHNKSHSINIDV